MTQRPTPRDAALDYALGGLTGEERARLRAERAFDAVLDAEIASLEEQFAGLSVSQAAIAPGPDVFARIEQALDEEGFGLQGVTVERREEGGWSQAHPGIDMKPLWDGRSWLLRCAPGSVIPMHPHGAEERLIVLMGDMIVGGETFGPGDTLVHAVTRVHAPTTTRGGCLIMVQYVN